MKIVHLSHADAGGGAARGAYWLHRALRESGIDSHMLVALKQTDDPFVHEIKSGVSGRFVAKARVHIDRVPLRLYPECRFPQRFSPGLLPSLVQQRIGELKPDVLDVHWAAGGMITPAALARSSSAIVWTLRDMWPFTGGCHYAGACTGYESVCGRCPRLGSTRRHDLSTLCQAAKSRAYSRRDFEVVALSNWLADRAARSSVMRGKRITVIPNTLDLRQFRPVPKDLARALLQIPHDDRVVAFGALAALRDQRKGFSHFQDALARLHAKGVRFSPLVFGAEKPSPDPLEPFGARYLGTLHDDLALSAVYSASDVMVVPSIEEAFGKTALESLACGTPVVCFEDTGMVDVVTHRETGYVARLGDPGDLADGIAWLLDDDERRRGMGEKCRTEVEQRFAPEIVVGRYADVYRATAAAGG